MNYDYNALAHYGVLGMKWGVRRARVNAAKAQKARSKGKTDKAEKYEAKSKKILSKHTNRTSKATVDRVSKASTGKLFLESVLLGSYGALKYEQARAEGSGRAVSYAETVMYRIGNQLTGGLMSIVEPRIRERSNRNKS